MDLLVVDDVEMVDDLDEQVFEWFVEILLLVVVYPD
jgi:hypothetical protein